MIFAPYIFLAVATSSFLMAVASPQGRHHNPADIHQRIAEMRNRSRAHAHNPEGRTIKRRVVTHHSSSPTVTVHPTSPGLQIWMDQLTRVAANAWVDDYVRRSQELHEKRKKECEPKDGSGDPIPPNTENNPPADPTKTADASKAPATPQVAFEDLPKSAKAFALFSLTYGCSKSEIFNQFLTLFLTMQQTNRTENVTDVKDRQWLTAIAERELEVEPANTTVAEAQATLSKLGELDRCALYEGELEMPIAARIFIHFVKEQGCTDAKIETYNMFNQFYLTELAALPPRRYPSHYFLAKAQVALADHFPKME